MDVEAPSGRSGRNSRRSGRTGPSGRGSGVFLRKPGAQVRICRGRVCTGQGVASVTREAAIIRFAKPMLLVRCPLSRDTDRLIWRGFGEDDEVTPKATPPGGAVAGPVPFSRCSRLHRGGRGSPLHESASVRGYPQAGRQGGSLRSHEQRLPSRVRAAGTSRCC